jgi:glutathione S-transferase
MPLGQLPALEYDGTMLCQSLTIARFLAKEFGLAGKTNLEQAQADMIIDAGNDLANSESHRPHF